MHFSSKFEIPMLEKLRAFQETQEVKVFSTPQTKVVQCSGDGD